ncbi:MAG: right-handed parallel beta-helix repeat-containing protein [Thermodesulfobacteriota bacterium]
MSTRNIAKVGVVVSALVLCLLPAYTLAGSLNPPGPPTPTMKTLDQVEARTPISQADIPLIISARGSFYLTGNITAAQTAITITADSVTIDLNGFAITGPGAGNYWGINANGRPWVVVRNGFIRSFRNAFLGGDDCVADNLVVRNCSLTGIQLNDRARITNCVVTDCSGSGIQAHDMYIISNNVSSRNLLHGIIVVGGGIITNNVVDNNSANGIYGDFGQQIITYNHASYNSQYGISVVNALIYYNVLGNNTNGSISCSGACNSGNNLE